MWTIIGWTLAGVFWGIIIGFAMGCRGSAEALARAIKKLPRGE